MSQVKYERIYAQSQEVVGAGQAQIQKLRKMHLEYILRKFNLFGKFFNSDTSPERKKLVDIHLKNTRKVIHLIKKRVQ